MDQRKRRRIVGRVVTAVVLIGGAGLIAFGFMPKPIPVVSGKVIKRDLEVTVDESGKTRIRSRYVVSAPVMGSLSRITLKAGDLVNAGDPIAEISPSAPVLLDQRSRAEASARVAMSADNLSRAQVAVKRAEAGLAFAREQANRQRALHAGQGASKAQLDKAEFELRAAEEDFSAAEFGQKVAAHELAMARATLESMTTGKSSGPTLKLTAPITGRVLRVYQESEGVVQPGTQLLELGDPRALEVVVDVLTTDAVKIQPGAEARIERWGGDHPLNARVRKKEPSAFTTRSALGVEEQRVPVVLDLVDPPDTWAQLGDGYRVETRIRTAYLPQATVVPASALFREGTAWAAFKINGGHAHKLSLEVGARTPDWVELKKGMKPGDRVVLYPSDQVHDGVEVEGNEAPK